MSYLLCKNRTLELSNSPLIMGILNATPDSFSDGGKFVSIDSQLKHSIYMLENGANIIDIGGESTRPGSDEISASLELDRVLPIIKELKKQKENCYISIDTRKPEVAEKAIDAGADIINDISGLNYSLEIADVAASKKCGLILMHMKGSPKTMQNHTNYQDFINEIKNSLQYSIDAALRRGCSKEQLVIDPGIGFAKNFYQNIELLNSIDSIQQLNLPLLVGPSRKSFIGKELKETNPQDRLWGTAGAACWLASKNIDIIRVHDVKEICQTLKIFCSIKNYNYVVASNE